MTQLVHVNLAQLNPVRRGGGVVSLKSCFSIFFGAACNKHYSYNIIQLKHMKMIYYHMLSYEFPFLFLLLLLLFHAKFVMISCIYFLVFCGI